MVPDELSDIVYAKLIQGVGKHFFIAVHKGDEEKIVYNEHSIEYYCKSGNYSFPFPVLDTFLVDKESLDVQKEFMLFSINHRKSNLYASNIDLRLLPSLIHISYTLDPHYENDELIALYDDWIPGWREEYKNMISNIDQNDDDAKIKFRRHFWNKFRNLYFEAVQSVTMSESITVTKYDINSGLLKKETREAVNLDGHVVFTRSEPASRIFFMRDFEGIDGDDAFVSAVESFNGETLASQVYDLFERNRKIVDYVCFDDFKNGDFVFFKEFGVLSVAQILNVDYDSVEYKRFIEASSVTPHEDAVEFLQKSEDQEKIRRVDIEEGYFDAIAMTENEVNLVYSLLKSPIFISENNNINDRYAVLPHKTPYQSKSR